MNFFRNILGAVLSLVVLVSVAGLWALSAQRPGAPPSATSTPGATAMPDATIMPGTTVAPGATATPGITVTPFPTHIWPTVPLPPTATLLPDRGVRFSPPREVPFGAGVVLTVPWLLLKAYGDTVVAVVDIQAARAVTTTIVTINLDTAEMQQIAVAQPPDETYFAGLSISMNYIAWIASNQNHSSSQIHVYDRRQRSTFTISQRPHRHAEHLDLKDNLVAWDESAGLYGYDLETGQEFTVPRPNTRPGIPRICSQQWLIYLENRTQQRWEGTADLRAYNWLTGEDILISQVPFRGYPGVGNQHACDGHQVAWLDSSYEQHVYDLDTRTGRLLDTPAYAIPALPDQLLDGDILIGNSGYDLSRNVAFNLPWILGPAGRRPFLAPTLSQGRFVWIIVTDWGEPQHLYTAQVVRDQP